MSSLPSVSSNLHSLSELEEINQALIPLKAIADKELASIFGLTGQVYTPHLDVYMQASVKKATIVNCLKKQGILPLSQVEIISAALDFLHNKVKSNTVVEYNGAHYVRKFSPLKLSSSGKNVRKWARYWLLQMPNGESDAEWEREVRTLWPEYFLIRTIEL